MIEIKEAEKKKVSIEVGDIVRFTKGGLVLVTFDKEEAIFPFRLVQLSSSNILNSHRVLDTVQAGCPKCGTVIEVYKSAELILGGAVT